MTRFQIGFIGLFLAAECIAGLLGYAKGKHSAHSPAPAPTIAISRRAPALPNNDPPCVSADCRALAARTLQSWKDSPNDPP